MSCTCAQHGWGSCPEHKDGSGNEPSGDHKADEICGDRLWKGGPRRHKCRWCRAVEGTPEFTAPCLFESNGDDTYSRKRT